MSAHSPATCASMCVSTARVDIPASAQRDISCREQECVKVSASSFIKYNTRHCLASSLSSTPRYFTSEQDGPGIPNHLLMETMQSSNGLHCPCYNELYI